MSKTIYTVKEVAKLLGFSTNTVYKYLDDGSIKAVRFGSEGRFRIPAGEVERLLHKKGEKLHETVLQGNTGNSNPPSIFDWFIGFLSMGLGFTQFINPVYVAANQSLVKFTPLINVVSIFLFLGGVCLLSFDLFNNKKGHRYNLLNSFIAVLYLVLFGVFLSQHSIASIGYLSVFLIVIISVFKKMDYYLRYVIYINILAVLIGVGFLLDPQSYSFSGLVPVDSISKVAFSLVWFGFYCLFLFCSLKSLKHNKHLVRGISFFAGMMALLYAVATFVSGMWGRSIFGMILGTFSFIFPFAGEFDSFKIRTRKEAAAGFFWLLAVFLVGSLVLRGIYSSFQNMVLAEMERKSETAAEITKNFMDGNVSVLSAFLNDNELPNLLAEGKLTENLDGEIRQIYLSSNNSFLRVIVTDDKGRIIDTYPFYLQSQNVDISDRDYFTNPKEAGSIFVTQFIQPNSQGIGPSILISFPIHDSNGRFLGVVIGSVDVSELQKRLENIDSDQTTTVTLVDNVGNYILNPDEQKIIAKAPEDSLVIKASSGESGSITAYDENGDSNFEAYRKVDVYDWGIMVMQPQLTVIETYNTMGLAAFLFFIVATVGSTTLVMFLRKNK